MSEPIHFTAWLTTTPSCLDQPFADLTVLQDEAITCGPDGEIREEDWSTDIEKPTALYAVTTVTATDNDDERALAEARHLLEVADWRIVGEWKGVDTGYTVTVERVAEAPADDTEEPTTYTAALTTDSTCVSGDYCDVMVAENMVTGYREDGEGGQVPVYEMGDTTVMEPVRTGIRTDADDDSGLEAEADQILQTNGWVRTAAWTPGDSSHYAPVRRI